MIGEAYAKVAIRVFDWMLPSAYRIRLKSGLIDTADGLQENSVELLKIVRKIIRDRRVGNGIFPKKLLSNMSHHNRQYRANRKKLR